jgi:hypothetical protein
VRAMFQKTWMMKELSAILGLNLERRIYLDLLRTIYNRRNILFFVLIYYYISSRFLLVSICFLLICLSRLKITKEALRIVRTLT